MFQENLEMDLLEQVEIEKEFGLNEFDTFDSYDQIITEDTIDFNNKITLQAHDERRYNGGKGGGYFKCAIHGEKSKNKNKRKRDFELCRISVSEPKYIYHTNDEYKLNKKQRDELVEMLEKDISKNKSAMNELPNIDKDISSNIKTNWDYTLYMVNRKNGFSDRQMVEAMKTNTIPKNMVPLDIPMPDYTKLPNK